MTEDTIADPARLDALASTGLEGTPPEEPFDRFTRLLAQVLGTPVTAISLVGAEAQTFKSAHGLPAEVAARAQIALDRSPCAVVVEHGSTLAVADVAGDPRFDGRHGDGGVAIGAYLGTPLRAAGHVVGTLCAIDPAPRAWTTADVTAIADLAACIEGEVALRAALVARDESAERHRAVVETAVDGIVTIDEDGVIASFNGAAEGLFGYRADEVVGANVRTLMPQPDRGAHDGYLERYGAGGEPRVVGIGREVTAQRKDGSTFPVHLSVGEMRVGGRRMFTGVIHDISVRRRAQEATHALLAEQAALRRVAEAVAGLRPPRAVFACAVQEVRALLGVEAAGMMRFTGPDEALVVGWDADGTVPRVPMGARLGASDLAGSRRAQRDGVTARMGPVHAADGTVFMEHVAAPIIVGASVWGTIVAGTTRTGGLCVEAEERLERVAGLVGLAIGQAVAHEELRLRGAQGSVMTRLSELALGGAPLDDLLGALTEAVEEVLGVDRAGVMQIAGDELVARWPASEGEPLAVPLGGTSVSALALRRDEAVMVHDRRRGDYDGDAAALSELHATMVAPIRAGGRPWGTLVCATRDEAVDFDHVDLLFLTALANVLSAALDRRQAEDEVRHQALHDPLTGLANRALLADRLALSLERATRTSTRVCILFVDVDHFKTVNDTHGHGVGDALLVAISERLVAAARPGDTVARLGGDEFVVVADDVPDEAAASALAARVTERLQQPFAIGSGVRATVSIGITLSTPDADVDDVLRDADIAMYRAKSTGRARTELFDDTMRERLVARVRTASELDRALAEDELLLHYQPIVSLADGDVVAVEALLRWQHPEHGLVGPDRFVDIAEESGSILALGRHVVSRACRDAAHWNRRWPGRPPLGVSVNLSPLQLSDAGIVDHVRDCLDAAGIGPAQLALEITETVLLDADPAQMARLAELRAMGVRLMLDDFGTGYASLAYLQRIELHALKLDRTFVAGLGVSVRDTAIVTAVTQMARGLGLQLVAEGIETPAQVASLQALDCPLGQGYLFARPQPRAGVDELLDGTPAWRRSAA